MSASLSTFERPRLGTSNTVFKSGPLFISSKGLGWTSWKKRWFILTRTSLVFLKNDPSALPQKGGEVNLTLGGMDLNNSGSVVVREDKKLLTVLFPDGRDGRAFTLKAETAEDLYEWKTALEHALEEAPSAALVMGHNGIFRNDADDTIEGSFHQWRDKRPVKSMVVGRPILLALEDIEGGPSFLEKALRFLEKYGVKVEGILRQCADVEEVDRRVQEYEQGKNEFDPDEDAHVVGDCVKHVLRELPSSPVPASCCTALLEAYKMDRKEVGVNSMRSVILETFPEPNRRLLQRKIMNLYCATNAAEQFAMAGILKMMHTISEHTSENRMTPSAVAACMAPLLLRPLLAGECELDNDFDVNDDNSALLLAAANAANNAQAIITTLLEEYENIFDDDNLHRCSISADSRSGSGSADSTDDDNLDLKNNGYHDAEEEVIPHADVDHDRVLSGKLSESSSAGIHPFKPDPSLTSTYCVCVFFPIQAFGGDDSDVGSPRKNFNSASKSNLPVDSLSHRESNIQLIEQQGQQKQRKNETDVSSVLPGSEYHLSMGEVPYSMNQALPQSVVGLESCVEKSMNEHKSSTLNAKQSTFWGRSTARKTPSMDSVDSSGDEELAIQRLEITKNDLRQRIAKEARGNATLQASLERRKQALHERRLALEQDVSRLQEQLQAERDLRAALEVGLSMSSGQFLSSHGMDSKTRAELEEIAFAEADVARLKQKVADLHHQLNQQRQLQFSPPSELCDHYQHVQNHKAQQKYFQQDFDATPAFVNHERKHRIEESLFGAELKNIKGPMMTSGISSKQLAKKQFIDSASFSDSRGTEASINISMDELCGVDSLSMPSTSRVSEVNYPRHPTAASSTLVELTSRLDFFKERRSQLMEQLHNLDLNSRTAHSHDFAYKNGTNR
ncbi:hypothetical protein RHGRI_002073 [Rhododendron griersonianum]|uniref:Rho GTPase activation protein n=1 Tax=Rhododendron griersonianum TaxID=479676 RepID=A0AAV6LME5_9ERIC|nr:hypothetical protein RHGRI_002073 [Rhododendron griersonianum]